MKSVWFTAVVANLAALLLVLPSTDTALSTKDNLVPYSDATIVRFPSQTSQYYNQIKNARRILINNGSVYIGATNKLAAVTLNLKTEIAVKTVEPSDEDKNDRDCTKDACNNDFTALLPGNGGSGVKACGTMATSQKCWSFNSTLGQQTLLEDTESKSYPAYIEQGVTTLKIGTSTILGSKKLYKFSNNKKEVETSKKQLLDPNFISSYEFSGTDYVYVFLTEVATVQDREYLFSRVARMCKYETKVKVGPLMLTFLKSQLLCTMSGERIPLYYNEIQASVKVIVGGEEWIYAVFSTSSDNGALSAVCRYRVKDIKNTFEVSQLKDVTATPVTEKKMKDYQEKMSRADCKIGLSFEEEFGNDAASMTDVVANSLLYKDVNPFDGFAFFTTDSRITSIVVDQLDTSSTLILFLGGVDGLIKKVSFSPKTKTWRIVEYIQPFNSESQINDLVLKEDMIYAVGSEGVALFPVHRCTSYVMCQDCLSINDPYCVWNSTGCMRRISADSSITTEEQCPAVSNDYSCKITMINKASFKCTLYSSLDSVKIVDWTRSKKQISEGNLYYIKNNGKESILIIKNLTSDAAGVYQCIMAGGSSRRSCNYTLATATTTVTTTTTMFPPNPNNTNNTAHSTATTTTILTTATTTADLSITVITPGSASLDEKQVHYFKEFMIVLVILVILVLLLIIALIVWFVRRRRTNNNAANKPSTNGLSPSKRKKYKVNGKDDSLLATECVTAGEQTDASKTPPSPPSPKIEHNVHYAANGQENVELGVTS